MLIVHSYRSKSWAYRKSFLYSAGFREGLVM